MPRTLTDASYIGSSTLRRTSICAARWTIASYEPSATSLRGVLGSDVDDVQRRGRRNVLPLAARQVVDDVDRPALFQEQVGHVRPDEPRPARDEHPSTHSASPVVV